jgi:hypothetical protein
MDSARQALRWSIPGFVFVLLVFLFDGIRSLFGIPSGLWQAVAGDGRLLLGIAAAGLPIGFMMYQIYFWVYWAFPFPAILRLGQPENRAWDVLKDVLSEIDLRGVVERQWHEAPDDSTRKVTLGPFSIRVKDREVMQKYRDNWQLADFLWHRTIVQNKVDSLERKTIALSDVYHGLGTCRWSIVFAVAVHVSASVAAGLRYLGNWRLWLAFAANTGLAVLFFAAFHSARYDTLSALLQFKHDFITYYHRLDMARNSEKRQCPFGWANKRSRALRGSDACVPIES